MHYTRDHPIQNKEWLRSSPEPLTLSRKMHQGNASSHPLIHLFIRPPKTCRQLLWATCPGPEVEMGWIGNSWWCPHLGPQNAWILPLLPPPSPRGNPRSRSGWETEDHLRNSIPGDYEMQSMLDKVQGQSKATSPSPNSFSYLHSSKCPPGNTGNTQ